MRKSILIPGIILAIGIAGMVLLYPGKKEGITVEVYEVPGGYGYLVKNDSKVLIRQDMIPSIQQISPFCSYDDAKAVAALVKRKMLRNEHPAITKEELKALHVQIKCLDLAE
ncbi:DUF4907 domain-containing protein [Sinomicrobium weinanense]|uniref:DUF4907 domain-containing protein n=1 Tax=Sinomicrobium weinanense TaxID=2842200 RepID=A0A926JPD4_9FLAO|nr:DUF4907 domain-containing protein [Sinomicrobium weinanense]MBC9795020.1 DUF4907 domain-containing protein [Sinomicrobium weinanense]MBU3125119.1 DUF4907 domain-containing protein [Sinomicrobium weinanense]